MHIIKSSNELTKKYLIDALSKWLLGYEFKTNHSTKPKCLKLIVKKYGLQYKRWYKKRRIMPAPNTWLV